MEPRPAAPPAPPAGLRLSEILTVRDQTDASGRLLLEDSAPKRARREAHRAGVSMKSVPCAYKDTPSRVGGLMNVSAYEALRHDTAEMLDGFAWLRRHYVEREPANAATVQGLLDTTNLGLSLPLVLFHRGDDPVAPHRRLPSYVASMFKASRGVFSAAVDMSNRAGPSGQEVASAEVVTFAEREGHLRRRQTGRVCAAPTRLIEHAIDAILTGRGAEAERSGLEALVDFATLWDFYTLQESFNHALSRYRFHLDRLLGSQAAALAAPGDLAGRIAGLFGRTVREAGRTGSFREYTEAVLYHVNSAQSRLNSVLGRRDDAPPVTFEDLVAIL